MPPREPIEPYSNASSKTRIGEDVRGDDFEKQNAMKVQTSSMPEEVDALDGEINEREMEVNVEKSPGADPFLVVFDPGDIENPKVSTATLS